MPRSLSAIVLSASLTAAIAAQGTFESGFDNYAASAAGTPVAGQDGFFVPATNPASNDWNVFTFAGNTLGVPVNVFGGPNFLAGNSSGTLAAARTQRPALVTSSSEVHIEFDVCVRYLGSSVPAGEIGSLSLEPVATSSHPVLLARWPAGTTLPPATWDADLLVGPTAAGIAIAHPDAHFHGLPVNVWHRWGCSIDTRSGQYTLFKLDNGASGSSTLYVPPAGSLPLVHPTGAVPTAFRLSAHGSAGTVLAVDRLQIAYHAGYEPYGAGCPGALGVPALATIGGGRPVLSLNFFVAIGNLPLGVAIMATGFSNTASGALVLPLDLGPFGMTGCSLLADPAANVLLVGAGSVATWRLFIPYDPLLMGAQFFNQAFSLDPTANATGISASRGARGTVGW